MSLHKHKTRTIGIQPVSPASKGRGRGIVRKPTTVGRRRTTLKRKIV